MCDTSSKNDNHTPRRIFSSRRTFERVESEVQAKDLEHMWKAMSARPLKISPVQKPNHCLDDILSFERRIGGLSLWLANLGWFRSAASCDVVSPSQAMRVEKVFRIQSVKNVFFCTEPFDEAGRYLRHFCPRALLRWGRWLDKRAGPAGGEIGHSYVILEVDMLPDSPSADATAKPEFLRLNWGQGIKYGSCLTVFAGAKIPPRNITGERLERKWPATCSGEELVAMLTKWNLREYDVNPANLRNCHHFVQDVIQQCTSADTGYRD